MSWWVSRSVVPEELNERVSSSEYQSGISECRLSATLPELIFMRIGLATCLPNHRLRLKLNYRSSHRFSFHRSDVWNQDPMMVKDRCMISEDQCEGPTAGFAQIYHTSVPTCKSSEPAATHTQPATRSCNKTAVYVIYYKTGYFYAGQTGGIRERLREHRTRTVLSKHKGALACTACPALPCPACPTLACPSFPRAVPPHLALQGTALPQPSLSIPALPNTTFPCPNPALCCPALPYLVELSTILPCLKLPSILPPCASHRRFWCAMHWQRDFRSHRATAPMLFCDALPCAAPPTLAPVVCSSTGNYQGAH